MERVGECAGAASKLCVVEPARGIFAKRSSGSSFAFCFWAPIAIGGRTRLPRQNIFPAPGQRWRRIPHRPGSAAQRFGSVAASEDVPAWFALEEGQQAALTLVRFLERRAGRGQDRPVATHQGGRHGKSRLRRVIGFPQPGQRITQAARFGGRPQGLQSSRARMRAHFALAAGLHQPK